MVRRRRGRRDRRHPAPREHGRLARRERVRQLPGRAASAARRSRSRSTPYLTDPAHGDDPQRARTRTPGATSTTTTRPAPAEEVDPRRSPRRASRSRASTARTTVGNCDAAHLCSWDAGVASSWDTNREQNAVQVFWYVNRFHDHLAAAADRLRRRVRDFEGARRARRCRPTTARHRRRRLPDGGAPQQREHGHAARRPAAGDADVPVREPAAPSVAVPRRQRRRRRLDRLPRVHARPLEPPDHRRDRRGRARLAAGRGDGRGLERLVRQGLRSSSENPAPDTAADGEIDMGAYVDAPAAHDPDRRRSTAASARPPRGARARRRPAPAATRSATSAAIDGEPPTSHADGEIWGETLWDLRKLLGSRRRRRRSSPAACACRRRSPRSSSSATRSSRPTRPLFGGIHVNTLWGVFAQPRHGLRRLDRGLGPTRGRSRRFDPPPAGGAPPRPRAGRRRDAAGGARERRRPVRVSRAPDRDRGPLARPRARAFTVGCSSACRATATMTVSRVRAVAGLGRPPRGSPASPPARLPGAAAFALTFGLATMRRRPRQRSARITSAVTVTVAVRDSRGQTRSVAPPGRSGPRARGPRAADA